MTKSNILDQLFATFNFLNIINKNAKISIDLHTAKSKNFFKNAPFSPSLPFRKKIIGFNITTL